MSEYLGSAFASFVGHRRCTSRSVPDHVPAESLPFQPLPIPPPATRPSKRMRYGLPTVWIPEAIASPPVASPVSVLSVPAGCSFPPMHALSPVSSTGDAGDMSVSDYELSPRQASLLKRPREVSPVDSRAVSSRAEPISRLRSADTRPGRKNSNHRKRHSASPKNAVDENRSLYGCPHCSVRFDDSEGLLSHVKSIHQRPFACRITGCTACFSKQNHLSRHIRIVHNKERPFACEEPGCSSRFGSKSHLGDHTRAVHMRLRNFKCNICDASWSKRFNLEKHIRIRHLGEKPFKCETCNLSFGTRSHVTRHEMKVHRNGGDDTSQSFSVDERA